MNSNPDVFALTNTTDYPFGTRPWTVRGDPCYEESELTVWLNMNACNETEFNCADGQCVHVAQRCDGKVDCDDKTGGYPTNTGIAMGTLSVSTLVVVSDGGRDLGCSKVCISIICHLHSVSTPGQGLQQ